MNDVSKHIATILKSLRQEYGWSLDKASEATGVSKAMLGQIERQESSPTVSTLWKISTGFNKSFSFFFEALDAEPYKKSKEKILITPLFPFDQELRCEILSVDLLPSCEHLSVAHKAGIIEHIIVIEGTIEILLNNNWQILHSGEGLRFNADQPHGYRNLTNKISKFHNIIHYPASVNSNQQTS